jgi:hypothetical protein
MISRPFAALRGARPTVSSMKLAALALLCVATTVLAGVTAWKEQAGQFATFQVPATLTRDSGKRSGSGSGNTISEAYRSADLTLTFDSESPTLPPTLQKQFDRTVATWTAQRKTDWHKAAFVPGGGGIEGSDNAKDPSGLRYYLFLNCAIGESDSFGVHIRFRSLDRLDDIERILKSIRFKGQ